MAFEKHVADFPNSYLLFIGPDETKDKFFLDKINKNKNIIYLGFTKNVHLYIPFFRGLILPSYREGFGSVILEAGACSVPAIASDIPGPKDFVKHLFNGYLINPKDIQSLKLGNHQLH